jgi:hypothetical protein
MKRFWATLALVVFTAASLVYFNVQYAAYAAAVSASPPLAVYGSADRDWPQCAPVSEQIDDLRRELLVLKSQLRSQQSQSVAKQLLEPSADPPGY